MIKDKKSKKSIKNRSRKNTEEKSRNFQEEQNNEEAIDKDEAYFFNKDLENNKNNKLTNV